MAYDEQLAERVRPLMRRRKGFSEMKMFGGVGFSLSGNMCVGVWKEFLILRLGVENYETALSDPDTREFDITGRAMRGWVMVEPAGLWFINLATSGLADGSPLKEHLLASAAHMRLLTMGVILLLVLRFSPKGLIPER